MIVIIAADQFVGAATAEYFVKQRGLVVLVGQNENKLKTIIERSWDRDVGNEPLVILASIITDSERIINETIAKFGRIDILINAFGTGISGSILNMNIEDFDIIMTTNVRAAILLTQKAIKHLEKTKGNIINISSICSITPYPNYLAYSISKAALNQFTKCVAMELKSKRIRVNAICTAFNVHEFLPLDSIESDELVRIEKCVKAIAFLARDQEYFLSGAVIPLPVTDSKSTIHSIEII